MLDFRKAPGSKGGKAGEASRFVSALKAMGSQQNRDTFSTAELQVGLCVCGLSHTHAHARACAHRQFVVYAMRCCIMAKETFAPSLHNALMKSQL